MKIEEAIKLVNDYLRKSEVEMDKFGSGLPNYINPKSKLQILTEYTEIHEFGWIFYYNSVKYIKTGDFRYALGGNAPLIINKHTNELIETGTARETSFYVNHYIKHGNLKNIKY